MGSNISEIPKRTSAGRNGSIGVLIMSVSSTIPEKSRGKYIYYKFSIESNSEKNFEYTLTFGEVTDKSIVSCFFLTQW